MALPAEGLMGPMWSTRTDIDSDVEIEVEKTAAHLRCSVFPTAIGMHACIYLSVFPGRTAARARAGMVM